MLSVTEAAHKAHEKAKPKFFAGGHHRFYAENKKYSFISYTIYCIIYSK